MATEYDKAGRYQIKHAAAGFFAWLWRHIQTPLAYHSWLDTRPLAKPEERDLISDLVAGLHLVNESVPTHALVVELKAHSEAGTLAQLQGYVYRLCANPPPELAAIVPRVGGIIINMTGAPQDRVLRATFPGVPACDWQFSVMQVNLREEAAATTLAEILAGQVTRWILPWIPLMHGGDEPSNMELWKQAAAAEPDEQIRATLVAFALLYAELANRGEAWRQALEGWNVIKSQIVEEWREGARVEAHREDLVTVLENRFGPLPKELIQQVQAVTETVRLKAAFRQALQISSLDQFQL